MFDFVLLGQPIFWYGPSGLDLLGLLLLAVLAFLILGSLVVAIPTVIHKFNLPGPLVGCVILFLLAASGMAAFIVSLVLNAPSR